MTLCCQNIQTTCGLHGLFIGFVGFFNFSAQFFRVSIRICGDGIHHLQLDIAAQFNIGAAPRHIGRNSDRAQFARICHNLRFLLMLTRVQNIMRQLCLGQKAAQHLGFLNRGCADQNRLALFMRFADRLYDGVIFLGGGAIDLIMVINPRHRAVGWNLNNAKFVNFKKFFGLSCRCARHATQFFVEAEVILECHRSQGHILRLDRNAFLGFDGLMQTIRQAPTWHHTAREFIDQDHLVTAQQIIAIF